MKFALQKNALSRRTMKWVRKFNNNGQNRKQNWVLLTQITKGLGWIKFCSKFAGNSTKNFWKILRSFSCLKLHRTIRSMLIRVFSESFKRNQSNVIRNNCKNPLTSIVNTPHSFHYDWFLCNNSSRTFYFTSTFLSFQKALIKLWSPRNQ